VPRRLAADNHRMRPRLTPPSRFRRLFAPIVVAIAFPAAAAALDLARYLPPPDADYVAEEVRVNVSGRCSLGGTLTLPTRGVLKNGHVLRYPAVLLLSGAGKEDRDGAAPWDTLPGQPSYRPLFDLADTLTRRGIAVLRLDDRGVGASTCSLDSMTTLDRTGDARSAVEYLRRRGEIDPHRIAVIGMSEGASIAALVAATDPEVRAIVLMAGPGLPGREVGAWQARARLAANVSLSPARRDSAFVVQMAAWDARASVDPWWRFDATYDPRVTARAVTAAALVLQGDADDTVPPAGADSLAAALGTQGHDVTLRHLHGLGHGFLTPAAFADPHPSSPTALRLPAAVRGAVADWTAARLGKATEGPAPHVKLRRHRRRRH